MRRDEQPTMHSVDSIEISQFPDDPRTYSALQASLPMLPCQGRTGRPPVHSTRRARPQTGDAWAGASGRASCGPLAKLLAATAESVT